MFLVGFSSVIIHKHIHTYIHTQDVHLSITTPVHRPMYLSSVLSGGGMRFVLTWPSPENATADDLTLKVYGPGKPMYVCICVCMYMCMYVCMFLFIHKGWCTLVYVYMRFVLTWPSPENATADDLTLKVHSPGKYMYVCMYLCVCICMHVMHVCVCMYICV
jgi:hypothetical protein